jgi:hypothetical protein
MKRSMRLVAILIGGGMTAAVAAMFSTVLANFHNTRSVRVGDTVVRVAAVQINPRLSRQGLPGEQVILLSNATYFVPRDDVAQTTIVASWRAGDNVNVCPTYVNEHYEYEVDDTNRSVSNARVTGLVEISKQTR